MNADITKYAMNGRQILRRIDRNQSYSMSIDDYRKIYNANDAAGTAFNAFAAGFYSGLSCAINRGFSKQNDPRKEINREVMNMTEEEIQDRITGAINAAGMSVEDISERTGVPQSAIQDASQISPAQYIVLCRLLQLEPYTLEPIAK